MYNGDRKERKEIMLMSDEYGKRIKKIADYHGVSINKLCKETKIPSSALYKWVRGCVKRPRESYIKRILSYFDIPIEELNGYKTKQQFVVVDQTPDNQNQYKFEYYTDANYFGKQLWKLLNNPSMEQHHIYVTTVIQDGIVDYKTAFKQRNYFDSSMITF